MRLRATVRIRNDEMIAAREALGWSQMDLAKDTGCHIARIAAFEKLDYTQSDAIAWAEKIALSLDIPVEKVLPPDLRGRCINTTHVKVSEVETERLLYYTSPGASKMIAHESELDVEKQMQEAERNSAIEKALECLTHREREIIKLRYGLGDGYTYTLEEAGKIFKVSRDRIRQIEVRAISKLQHPLRSNLLKDFVPENNWPKKEKKPPPDTNLPGA